jgi:endoglucanase
MSSRLSQRLPLLATSGNRILRADTGQAVLLRGVNRSGLEYSEPSAAGFLAAAEFTEDELREIVTNWRSNVIRIPFNQDWALHGRRGHTAEEYLAALDQVIFWAASFGAYTMLDLQWLDADTIHGYTEDSRGIHENHIAPLPNAESILLWETLADRYREETAVLFDLFNEPHDRLPDDPFHIHVIAPDGSVVEADRSVRPQDWTTWAARLTAEVRAIRPSGLLSVAGVDWGFDLSSIRIDARDILYSAHIYAGRNSRSWGKALGGANSVPVFVGEWGGSANELDFGRNLAAILRDRQLSWAAWSWVDHPQLIRPPRAPAYQPTEFGELVRGELMT